MAEAVILAGGLGTRLRSVVADRPKPMALVAGRPFLEWQLTMLSRLGITRVVLAVGYLGDQIQSHFGSAFDSGYRPMALAYSFEDEPLGTGGAIAQALKLCDGERVLVVNGDTYFEISYADLIARAIAADASCVVGLTRIADPSRYGLVAWDGPGHVLRGFLARGEGQGVGPHWINSGSYLLKRQAFLGRPWPAKFSFESDYLAPEATAGRVHAVANGEAFIDIGVPEDYARAQMWIPQQVTQRGPRT